MIKRWNILLIRPWKTGRDQEVNEMTKTELKQNITKITQILQSENYEAGFELLKTINEPELNEALANDIQKTVKEVYFGDNGDLNEFDEDKKL